MASRQVRGPDGRLWTIRERWLPRFEGLEADSDLDASEPIPTLSAFFVFDLLLLVLALLWYAVRLVLALPALLFRLSFLPPLIEAEHQGPPYSRMTWRAANRQIGPAVIAQVAEAIERGDRRIRVEGATFLGFATKP